jgi:hypothetical protein
MKKIILLSLILSLSVVFMHSCKKDRDNPPLLPPAESMTIDFSNFESSKKGEVAVSIPKGTANSNWEFAAGAAMLWKSIIYSTLAIPVYSFQKAIEQKNPVYLDDQTWQWSASASVLGNTYTARLTGQIAETIIIWKMYISMDGSGGYTDFVWFDGTSKLDGTSGQWKLYESHTNPVEIVTIDWSVADDNIGSVKYTFTKAGNAFASSYIEYGLTANALNSYYTIYYYNTQFEEFFDMNVEWSSTLNNGRVKCLNFYGTSDWYCWDGNHLNVTCP